MYVTFLSSQWVRVSVTRYLQSSQSGEEIMRQRIENSIFKYDKYNK